MRVCIIPGCPFVQYAIWAGSCVFRIVDVLICSLYRQVVCELMERVARMSMYFHKGRSVSRVLSRPYQRHDDMHHINILYLSGRGESRCCDTTQGAEELLRCRPRQQVPAPALYI